MLAFVHEANNQKLTLVEYTTQAKTTTTSGNNNQAKNLH